MLYLLVTVLLLLLLGLFLLWLGRHTQRQTGLPVGTVIYSDMDAWQQVEKPLISRRYGLVGRPDYLVQVGAMTVPVEVKSRKKPPLLLEYHALQLGAYCLLVEDHYQVMPAYGLLHYADATVQVPFTDQLRQQVIAAADAIRRQQHQHDVVRSHAEPARCRQCGYQQGCGGQKLA